MSDASQRKPLPFVANFAAGAIAGISEILTFYPLDVVKTRMQLETGKSKQGVLGSFQTIIKEEGFGRLYRGLLPPLLMEAPKRATKFAANDFWGKRFLAFSGEKKMTQQLAIATGCAAGATESFVVVPFELVKIKLQDKSSTFAGPMDVVRKVIKAEGPLGLYAGMEATMWRHFWWNGGYFGCIFQVRALLPKPETNKARLMNDLVAGTIGGLVGTAINTPFDVVKSRIQGASKVPGVVPKYNWTYPAPFFPACPSARPQTGDDLPGGGPRGTVQGLRAEGAPTRARRRCPPARRRVHAQRLPSSPRPAVHLSV